MGEGACVWGGGGGVCVCVTQATSMHLKGKPIALASLSRNFTTPSEKKILKVMYNLQLSV